MAAGMSPPDHHPPSAPETRSQARKCLVSWPRSFALAEWELAQCHLRSQLYRLLGRNTEIDCKGVMEQWGIWEPIQDSGVLPLLPFAWGSSSWPAGHMELLNNQPFYA